MQAFILPELGKTFPLALTTLPQPVIGPHEVLIKTRAIGINPVEYKTKDDFTTPHGVRASLAPSVDQYRDIVLGWDIAGVVVATGSEVTKFTTGDAVFGLVNCPGYGRAYAEYVAAPETHLAKKPAHTSFEAAAASTLAAVTAWQNVYKHHPLKKGDRILITAPAGGVGHYAVQMAKQAGAFVIALTSAQNAAFVKELGADEVIDYAATDLAQLASLQLPVILDVGGRLPAATLAKHLAPGGEILFLPHALSETEKQGFARAGINIRFTGVTSEEAAIEGIAQLLEDGSVEAHIHQTFAFADLPKALQEVEKGHVRGKVVVTV